MNGALYTKHFTAKLAKSAKEFRISDPYAPESAGFFFACFARFAVQPQRSGLYHQWDGAFKEKACDSSLSPPRSAALAS